MNAARRPDGPPVRDGKPYSAIAHLAEDVMPFVADGAMGCAQQGFSAPEIYAADLAATAFCCWKISAPIRSCQASHPHRSHER